MLIDLDAWRDSRMTERILHLLAKYHLPCADQDAINLSLKGSFDELPPKFNSMPYHLLTKLRNVDAVTDDDLIGVCISTPTILHFHRSFLGKPWTLGSIHPATNLWRALASEANPRWKRSTDFVGLLRRFAANQAKMLSLDIRSTDQSELIHKIY
jgi:lipopolysaccharide biosynthesis glycosyltransferase